MNNDPSTHGGNGDGRDPETGRFAPGWRGGRGNPLAGKAAKLRAALFDAVTEQEMREVVRTLLALALGGDVQAIKEVLDRCLGRPLEADLLQRLADLEAAREESL